MHLSCLLMFFDHTTDRSFTSDSETRPSTSLNRPAISLLSNVLHVFRIAGFSINISLIKLLLLVNRLNIRVF